MLLDKLKDYRVVLASKSPRRQELLRGMGVEFDVSVSESGEEIQSEWTPSETVRQLSARKAESVYSRLAPSAEKPLLVIGGDTIVVLGDRFLGKPHDASEAVQMLRQLSGRTHRVYSGLCVMTGQCLKLDDVCTEVTFSTLTEEDIDYYVRCYRPFDKAGAYGVQEWIGYRAISNLSGSFYNVMGLPTHRLWMLLEQLCADSSTKAFDTI